MNRPLGFSTPKTELQKGWAGGTSGPMHCSFILPPTHESNLSVKTFRDEDTADSLGHLSQHSTTFPARNLFLIFNLKLPCSVFRCITSYFWLVLSLITLPTLLCSAATCSPIIHPRSHRFTRLINFHPDHFWSFCQFSRDILQPKTVLSSACYPTHLHPPSH